MSPPADSHERGGPKGPSADRYTAADRLAIDRGRLRASEAAVAGEVIELQLARTRADLVVPDLVEPLTTREREVLDLLAGGRSDGEIASALFISKKTASVHVANIKGKLGAENRFQIALIAASLGLLPSAGEDDATTRRPPPAPRASIVCPFKGLASFELADARYFFGRERLVAAMVASLAGASFLGVVGPSGSGKSSVIRAGLLPALAAGVLPGSDEWIRVLLRPGADPAERLHQALQAADGTDSRLLLVIDQFEEVFTLCRDERSRGTFIEELIGLAEDPDHRALVIVVIRADFYGRCADHPALAAAMSRDHVLVGPMTHEELERAIVGPARVAGLRTEPSLVAALVRDLRGRSGALPMLSATLVDLWRLRDGRVLRAEGYERSGGVAGAVARLAESAYARLTPAQQGVARTILTRLVATADGPPTRRPVERTDFDTHDDPNVAAVLATFTQDRLLTAHDDMVEIAHEALITDWPRLRSWLEADLEGHRIRAHIERQALTWADGGEREEDLLRGARLAAALEWAADHPGGSSRRERRFLAASQDAEQSEVRRIRAINRRLRGLVGVATILLVVTLIASSLAVRNLGRAEREADIARARELAAAAVVAVDTDPTLSTLLALVAASAADPPLTSVSALHRSLATDLVMARYRWPVAGGRRVLQPMDRPGPYGRTHPRGGHMGRWRAVGGPGRRHRPGPVVVHGDR